MKLTTYLSFRILKNMNDYRRYVLQAIRKCSIWGVNTEHCYKQKYNRIRYELALENRQNTL